MQKPSHGAIGFLPGKKVKDMFGSGGELPAVDERVPDTDLVSELVERLRKYGTEDIGVALGTLLGILGMQIDELTSTHVTNRFSDAKNTGLLNRFLTHPDFSISKLRGAKVLDVGAGSMNPLGGLMVALMAGAQRCVAIEPDPLVSTSWSTRTLFKIAATMLACPEAVLGAPQVSRRLVSKQLEGFDLAKMRAGDDAGIDRTRLELMQGFFGSVDLPSDYFDCVYSTTFLEHVPDADAIVAEMSRVSARGSTGVHYIDLSDHRRYGNPSIHPLEFMRVETEDAIVHGSNRLRLSDFEAMFERHGFRLVKVDRCGRTELPTGWRDLCCSRYRDYAEADVAVIGAMVYLRKR